MQLESEPVPSIEIAPGVFLPGDVRPDSFIVIGEDGKPVVLYTPSENKKTGESKARQFHASDHIPNLLLHGPRGTGKALALNTPIPTPFGYSTMGDLPIGAQVFDEYGAVCRVVDKTTAHFDPSGTYRVTFDDGESIVCGGAHEWVTWSAQERQQRLKQQPEQLEKRRARRSKTGKASTRKYSLTPVTGRVRTTTEIAATLTVASGHGPGNPLTNHAVELAGEWQTPDTPLLLDPYVLGAWLGDGAASGGVISGIDEEVFANVEAAGFTINRSTHPAARYVLGLRKVVREVGVIGNKHIPEPYFNASPRQRLALLQGLMDTDGTVCGRQGTCEFTNTNIDLAFGVLRLTRSLGIKASIACGIATLYGRATGPKYRVTWTSDVPVFRMARKLERLPKTLRATQRYRYIVACDRIDDQLVQCIQVDSPSHLYLCGEAGIPTHNSVILRFDAHMRAMRHEGFTYLMLRRTMPQLRKSHLNFIEAEMKKLGGKYNKTENVAYYPNGSKGFFSHCETEADVLNLLSSQFDLVIFDELTTFSIDMFLKISACARVAKDKPYPALVRAGTNPLGESTGSVMKYFITKDVPPDGPNGNPDYDPTEFGDIFVGPDDNSYLDMAAYQRRLSQLQGHARKAWLDGTWEIEGAYFGDFHPRMVIDGENRPWHVIDSLPTVKGKPLLEQEWVSIYRAHDSGFFPDPAVCLWFAVLPNGRAIAFKEDHWQSTVASDVAKDIAKQSKGMRVLDDFADPTMFATSNHTGLADSDYYEQHGVQLTPSRNDRAAIGKAIHEWLGTIIDGEPRLQILREGCPQLIRTIPDMQIDSNDNRKIAGGGSDHWVIALGYFCQGMTAPSREFTQVSVPLWMQKNKDRSHVLGRHNVA